MSALNDMRQSIAWSQNLWDSIKMDGVWGVPRSGLLFRKTPAGFNLVDVARPTSESFQVYQRQDYECIVKHFALASLEVTDNGHLLK